MGSKSNHFWSSITDLMSGLMVIFAFVAVVFLAQMKLVLDKVIYVTEGFKDTEQSLYNELMKEFKNDLEDWNAYIDAKTLSIIFKEPDVLFEKGEYVIKDKFKSILDDFFPRYADVLKMEEFQEDIIAVRIEGHTSSEWKKDTKPKKAYLNNMSLSQLRASEVLQYTLATNLNGSYDWIRDRLQAVGFSSSKIKMDKEGKEDKDMSRRVEFKVVTNAQDKLYSLVRLTSKHNS